MDNTNNREKIYAALDRFFNYFDNDGVKLKEAGVHLYKAKREALLALQIFLDLNPKSQQQSEQSKKITIGD